MKKHLSYLNGISLLIVMIVFWGGGNNLYARETQKKSVQKNDSEILSAYKKDVAASIERAVQGTKLKSAMATDPVLAADSLVLVELYTTTNGETWINNTNWLTGPVNTWHGITVVSNRVTEIDLQKNNLTGTIPTALGNLSSLVTLELDTNKITGPIPAQLGNLTNLQFLYLAGNNFTGTIPVELANLTKLTLLYLADNKLSGTIPVQLANLLNLVYLDLSENQLEGTIPVQLGNLSNLEFLDLGTNSLTGGIPSEFGQLTNMIWMDFRSNQLSGPIPNLSLLSDLEMLYVNSNSLTGTIPSYLGSLQKLRWLHFSQNNLTGNILAELGNIPTLELLDLSDNDLTGTIPVELGGFTKILLLYLNGNGLTGEIPSELGNLSTLIWFDLAQNQLSGSIPVEFQGLADLGYFNLSENNLTGNIPTGLGNLSNLVVMDLSSNLLTGAIPANMGQLKKLKSLDFDTNQLDEMPDLTALDSLSELSVSNNKFTFEDLEYNMNINDTVNFVYAPQDSIGVSETFIKDEGETFTYVLTTGGTTNEYQWYKDGGILSTQTSGTIEISGLTVDDAGNYYCEVTSSLVPGLILTSREITLVINYCIDIPFSTGWNIFSSPVLSSEPDMETIFQPLITNESLLKIQDEEGKSLENLGIYGGWKNSIGDIALSEGYKVKMSANNLVQICGQTVTYPYPIPLKLGWNIISYPQTTAFDGLDLMDQLIDSGVLIKVQDERGSSIEDLGIYGDWKNDIGSFSAGEGYKVKVSASDTLWINNNYPKSNTIQSQIVPTAHFQKAFEGNGVDHMNIYLVNIDEPAIMEGDEIGIFDGNICVGATKITKQNSSYINLIASATDGNGEKANGFVDDGDIILRLYRNGKEYPMSLQSVNNTSPKFEKNGSAIVSANADLTTSVSLEGNEFSVNCYPNPFYENINIEINLQNEEDLTVEIYDIYSRKIGLLYSGKASGRVKLQWDGNDERGNRVAPGIYMFRVNKTWKKVMLNGN